MEQNQKNKTKKTVAILLVVAAVAATAAVLIPGYIQKRDEEKNAKILYDIWSEYQAGEYQNVLSLAETAPKPYDSYYKRFMTFRTELDSWHGTERELYEWLSAFMEQMDIETISENAYSTKEQLFSGVSLANYKEKLAKEREWIENELVWYPEFYQIRVEFYEEYFMLLIENRNLFGADPEAGIVTIPVSDMAAFDFQMNRLVRDSVQALNELQEKYNIVEDEEHGIISSEKEMMEDFGRDYDESGAVSSLYDLTGEKFIYISAKAAENNYDVFTKKIGLQVSSVVIPTALDSAFNMLFGVPDEYADREGPIAEILPIVYRIFPESMLSLSEPEFVSIDRVISDFVDAYIES